jgi:hypothetical protein
LPPPPPRTFIKPPVKIAQAPPPPEELEQPSDLQGTTAEIVPSTTPSERETPSSSQMPSTTIEENTDRTLSDGNGNPILEESSSRNTTINRTPPTADLKIKRTRVYDLTTGKSNATTTIGVKASTTGESGSASVDLSDAKTVIDNIPVNTAIGRTDGNTCKLTQKTAGGKVKKFEALKPEGGACIEGELRLTPSNHIEDGDTTLFTQQREGLPTGVTIEYKQIPKK